MYFILNLITAAVATFCTVYFNNLITEPYKIYVIFVYFIAFLALAILLTFFLFFLFGFSFKFKTDFVEKDNKFYRIIMDYAFQYFAFMCRIKIHFPDKKELPKDKRFILICNHRSNFDPMVISSSLVGYQLSWIAKRSIFKVPGINKYMHKCCYMPIDRDDIRQSISVIKQASKYINEDICSVGVFPEGHRNKTDDLLLELKPGVLKIAFMTKAPIYVITAINTDTVRKNFPLKRTHVYINLAAKLEYEDYKDLKTVGLTQKVEQIMRESLTKQYSEHKK